MSLDAPALSRSRGINAVRAVLINDRYLISGDQSLEAHESALRNIAAELAPVA
jgi:predicted DsbA family dithiol-disulfide isomerase